ncbi:hypothetical protein BDV28DRAFT_142090 [Aspergillus coremiiformis]|uniref:Uncharacterized protein n=1 Tax=Aspergillus coremiiformis TaxID=138285 RepID=A0A5N6YU50_9EURO|nr:hypothetical protein BDV28DRAFT_142090 [Aspergillus coremiiformis]
MGEEGPQHGIAKPGTFDRADSLGQSGNQQCKCRYCTCDQGHSPYRSGICLCGACPSGRWRLHRRQ